MDSIRYTVVFTATAEFQLADLFDRLPSLREALAQSVYRCETALRMNAAEKGAYYREPELALYRHIEFYPLHFTFYVVEPDRQAVVCNLLLDIES